MIHSLAEAARTGLPRLPRFRTLRAMSPPALAPVRPPRPVTVTIAFWLQLALVLILLGLAGLAVAEAVHFDGQITRAAQLVPDADPAEVTGERRGNIAMTLVIGVPAVLLAMWLVATAGPVRRGLNTARILVFVASGTQLLVCFAQCCSGGFLVPLLTSVPTEVDPTTIDSEDEWPESEFFEALYSAADPFGDLFIPVAGLSVLLVLTLSAAVVLLLALPPANRWFVPGTAPSKPPPAPAAMGWPSAYPSCCRGRARLASSRRASRSRPAT
ncbi:hypothetical protein GCM10027614_47260 [Micromonospora vulcania]